MRAALGLLLEGLPESAVAEGVTELVYVLRRVYRSVGLEPPEWMGHLLRKSP